MATCKDCLHHDTCVIVEYRYDDKDYYTEFGCDDYLPTADVVEVVRCKDCQHYINGCCYVKNRSPLFKYDVNIHHRKANDFCSYGEEK